MKLTLQHNRFLPQFLVSILLGLSLSLANAQSPDPEVIAKELYAAFSSGDMEKVMALYALDTVLIFHGPEDRLRHAGTFKGKQGIQDFFTQISNHFDITAIGQRSYSVRDNVVTVLGWEQGVGKATGGEYTSNWVHIITVEDGLITRFEEINDTATILDALAPADVARGQAFYTTCLGCHGNDGEGMHSMHAPRLTVQDSGYLIRQLRNFRKSIRGGVQDFYGWQMNGRALGLANDRALRDVVAYIGTLPKTLADDRISGSKRSGRKIYDRSCASCHGSDGEGIQTLNSPRLAGLDGWYQVEQLNKFRSGLRGSHESDVLGQQMRASMVALQSEKDIQDVVAYIMSLQ